MADGQLIAFNVTTKNKIHDSRGSEFMAKSLKEFQDLCVNSNVQFKYSLSGDSSILTFDLTSYRVGDLDRLFLEICRKNEAPSYACPFRAIQRGDTIFLKFGMKPSGFEEEAEIHIECTAKNKIFNPSYNTHFLTTSRLSDNAYEYSIKHLGSTDSLVNFELIYLLADPSGNIVKSEDGSSRNTSVIDWLRSPRVWAFFVATVLGGILMVIQIVKGLRDWKKKN